MRTSNIKGRDLAQSEASTRSDTEHQEGSMIVWEEKTHHSPGRESKANSIEEAPGVPEIIFESHS